MIPFRRAIPTARPADLESWTNRLVLLALFCVAALVMSQNQSDPDLWGHLQYGLDAMRFGLPAQATYQYTAPDHDWINHEWAWERLLAWGWNALGGRGLLMIKFGLGLALLMVIYRRNRSAGIDWFPAAALMLAIGVNLMLAWKLRPQLFSFCLLAVTLWLLDRAFGRLPGGPAERERPIRFRYLAALPPLVAAWTNLHGAFAAGVAIIGLYLSGRAIERFCRQGRAAMWDVMRIVAVIAATLAATFVNPYTWRLHVWLWHSLSVPRPEILEWRPPELWNPAFTPFWILALGTVVAAWTARRRIDVIETIVLAALLWQATRYHRHIPLFVVAAAWWMPHVWHDFLKRMGKTKEAATSASPRRTVTWVVASLALAASLIIGQQVIARSRFIVVRSWDYPVDAFQFIQDHQLKGRMVVQFMWAQYALAAFGNHDDPRGQGGMTVAFDGRFRTCYPQQVVDMYFDFASGMGEDIPRYRSPQSPPYDPARILEAGHPDLVLMNVQRAHAHRVIAARRDEWVLLYRDGLAELWGRRSRYDDPRKPTYLPAHQRVVRDDAPRRVVPFPAFPSSTSRAAQRPVGTLHVKAES